MSQHDIQNFVVISTTHLTERTARYLDKNPASEWPCVGGPYGDYGWFVYAHDEDAGSGQDRIPDDLFAVMAWARKEGFAYVLLDCDGNVVDALPKHDW